MCLYSFAIDELNQCVYYTHARERAKIVDMFVYEIFIDGRDIDADRLDSISGNRPIDSLSLSTQLIVSFNNETCMICRKRLSE